MFMMLQTQGPAWLAAPVIGQYVDLLGILGLGEETNRKTMDAAVFFGLSKNSMQFLYLKSWKLQDYVVLCGCFQK